MKYGKTRGKAAIVIDIMGGSFIILDPLAKYSQYLLNRGIIAPIQVSKQEAIDIMGEEKVLAFENMYNNINKGGVDYRLTRYIN